MSVTLPRPPRGTYIVDPARWAQQMEDCLRIACGLLEDESRLQEVNVSTVATIRTLTVEVAELRARVQDLENRNG